MIAIVDTGLGNLGSLRNMFRRIGVAVVLSSDATDLRAADKLVLPGVGSFDAGMGRLRDRDLAGPLTELVMERGVPCLGVCLGMQLMTRGSEEGSSEGLGWVQATSVRLRVETPDLKVPHMGWNTAEPARPGGLFEGADHHARYYFVHSYHVVCENDADIAARTVHGVTFTSALHRGNVMATQFHPEKSHRFGMRVLANFAGTA